MSMKTVVLFFINKPSEMNEPLKIAHEKALTTPRESKGPTAPVTLPSTRTMVGVSD